MVGVGAQKLPLKGRGNVGNDDLRVYSLGKRHAMSCVNGHTDKEETQSTNKFVENELSWEEAACLCISRSTHTLPGSSRKGAVCGGKTHRVEG